MQSPEPSLPDMRVCFVSPCRRKGPFNENSIHGKIGDRLMEMSDVLIGDVSGKGEVHGEVERLHGIQPILRIAVEDTAFLSHACLEDIENVPTSLPIVDDHRHIETSGNIELSDEQFNLRVLVSKIPVVVETDLSDGHHSFEL